MDTLHQQGLLQGLGRSTPVAVVQHASLPQQRHAVGLLGDLTGLIEREGLGSPAIIVVGDVIRGVASLSRELAHEHGVTQAA